MNNLITCPLSFICSLHRQHALQPEPGIHVFHDTSSREQVSFQVLTDLYSNSDVFVTEHDTSCGGDLETRHLLELFRVSGVPCVFFVFPTKKGLSVNKYFGSVDADTLVSLYERVKH
jgi:hypothetical protein